MKLNWQPGGHDYMADLDLYEDTGSGWLTLVGYVRDMHHPSAKDKTPGGEPWEGKRFALRHRPGEPIEYSFDHLDEAKAMLIALVTMEDT